MARKRAAKRKPVVAPPAKRRGYEPSDISIRGLALVAALFAGVVAVSAGVLGLALQLFRGELREERPPPAPLDLVDLVPPEPRLQVEPVEELAEVLAPQFELLASYGWVDREAGLARIPIERAMAILAERGWPEVAGEPGGVQGGPPARPRAPPPPPEDEAGEARIEAPASLLRGTGGTAP